MTLTIAEEICLEIETSGLYHFIEMVFVLGKHKTNIPFWNLKNRNIAIFCADGFGWKFYNKILILPQKPRSTVYAIFYNIVLLQLLKIFHLTISNACWAIIMP